MKTLLSLLVVASPSTFALIKNCPGHVVHECSSDSLTGQIFTEDNGHICVEMRAQAHHAAISCGANGECAGIWDDGTGVRATIYYVNGIVSSLHLQSPLIYGAPIPEAVCH